MLIRGCGVMLIRGCGVMHIRGCGVQALLFGLGTRNKDVTRRLYRDCDRGQSDCNPSIIHKTVIQRFKRGGLEGRGSYSF